MAQFKAEAGVQYKNTKTGQTISYNANDLQNEAIGWLSSDYQKIAAPAALSSGPTQPNIPTTNTNIIKTSDIKNAAPSVVNNAPINTRKLGPTEFNNLVQGWRNYGLTDQEIEKNFLTRQGPDIYLKNNAPSQENIISSRISETKNNAKEEPQQTSLSALDRTEEIINNYQSNKQAVKTGAMQDEGVAEIQRMINDSQKISNDLQAKIEQMQSDLNLKDILNEEAVISLKNKIEGQPIPMSEINAQLTNGIENLTQDQRIARLYNVYSLNTMINSYNASTRAVQLYQGQYKQAMENVQNTINDWAETQQMKLDLLEQEGQLEKEDKAKAEAEIEFERNLGLQGYTYIPNTETYNKIVKQFNVNAGNFSNFFYKDISTGKVYLKPGAQEPIVNAASGKSSGGGRVSSGGKGLGPSQQETSGDLTDFDILSEAVSNKLGSVAAKKSFEDQFSKAKTDEQKIKILASNVVLPTEIKNGIIQNTQVIKSLDSVLGLLDSGAKTGLLEAGKSYVANKLGTGGDKQVEAIKSKLVAAVQPYRNKVTGAAWGDQEELEYQALIGTVRFTPEDLRNKLEIFKATLKQQSQTALLAGIDPLGAINENSPIQYSPQLSSTISESTNNLINEQPKTTKGFLSKAWDWLFGDN